MAGQGMTASAWYIRAGMRIDTGMDEILMPALGPEVYIYSLLRLMSGEAGGTGRTNTIPLTFKVNLSSIISSSVIE